MFSYQNCLEAFSLYVIKIKNYSIIKYERLKILEFFLDVAKVLYGDVLAY